MGNAGTVTNLTTVRTQKDSGKSTAANVSGKPCAECSRVGEDNSKHIAIAIVAIAVLAVAAGALNARVSVGRS